MTQDLYEVPDTQPGSADEDLSFYGAEDYRHQVAMMRAFDPYDLKGVNSPWLTDGDRKSRDAFRIKYLAYLQKHKTVMRKRHPMQRVLPKTVVECIKPALLMYICKHLLDKKDRTSRPEKVKALVIHRWVMQRREETFGADDNDGVAAIKKLKIELNGEFGV